MPQMKKWREGARRMIVLSVDAPWAPCLAVAPSDSFCGARGVPPWPWCDHLTIVTGVPTSTLLKKISAILPGIRIHPWDAG
jgi:hypothetical protein